MEKEKILQKAHKKHPLGEMEAQKINKSNWIAVVVAGVVAVALMITEGALGHFTGLYAIGFVCFTWASVFYACQYFIAKRPYGVLIGAILEAIGAIMMLTLFILTNVGVM